MKKEGKRKSRISVNAWFNILILAIFTIVFIVKENYEFLLYIATIAILVWIIEKTDKMFHYPKIAKYGFSLWMILHFLGASVYIAGEKLYALILIPLIGSPYNILKYDQFMHFYTYVVITILIYTIVMSIANKKANKWVVYIIIVLAGSSIGAINEIIEFTTVILFDAGHAVGGYYNTLLDLVFNFVGAIVAVILVTKFPNHYNNK